MCERHGEGRQEREQKGRRRDNRRQSTISSSNIYFEVCLGVLLIETQSLAVLQLVSSCCTCSWHCFNRSQNHREFPVPEPTEGSSPLGPTYPQAPNHAVQLSTLSPTTRIFTSSSTVLGSAWDLRTHSSAPTPASSHKAWSWGLELALLSLLNSFNIHHCPQGQQRWPARR